MASKERRNAARKGINKMLSAKKSAQENLEKRGRGLSGYERRDEKRK